MTFVISPDPVPLWTTEHGSVRVRGTRVGLEIVVDAYDEGATPEEIVRRYDTLSLADVYATIAYYLRHREEVRAYMDELDAEFERGREEAERRFGPQLTREQLLARRARAR
jgi:uncharacterized protein (DUF433 family)